MLPKNFPVDLISKYKNNKYLKCVSFDGDGDRIVY
jgi:phosphomannomutase